MKITWKDLPQKYEEIKKHLSKETKDAYEASVGFWDMYDDPDFRPSIDDVVELINNEIKNVDNNPAPKPKKEPKPKPKKEPKVEPKFKVGDRVVRVTGLDKGTHKIVEIAVKSNGDIFYRFADGELNEWWIEALLEKVKKEPKPKPKQVNAISPAVKYISRYVKLHGKKYDSEAKNKARLILTALQKSILALEIRKTDLYADEVNKMQNKLLKLVNGKCDQKAISIEGVEKLKEIAKGVAVNPAISMLRAFVALVGKSDVKEKAKALAVKINAANKTEANYDRQLHAALKSLNAYTSGDTAVVEADQQTLEGLYGLCGIDAPRERKHSASAAELANTYFDTIQMTGKWARIIGKPSAPFKIMIYGKPGSGKSTLALQHAGYMAKNHHHNVLYVAAEEGISYTMKDKLSRLGISDSNLTIVDELPKDLSKWDTIFIDSIQTAHLTPEDLRKLPKNKNYVYVFQTTKDGNFRGAQEYLHDVDTCVKVEEMRACTEKNRFGAMGSCGVLDGNSDLRYNWEYREDGVGTYEEGTEYNIEDIIDKAKDFGCDIDWYNKGCIEKLKKGDKHILDAEEFDGNPMMFIIEAI